MSSSTTTDHSITNTTRSLGGATDRASEVTTPMREQVVAQIILEAGCTEAEAEQLIDMLQRAVDYSRSARSAGYTRQDYFLDDADLAGPHSTMEKVMEDNVTDPAPGSAHAMLNRLLLTGNEITLEHDSAIEDGIRYCTVATGVRIV